MALLQAMGCYPKLTQGREGLSLPGLDREHYSASTWLWPANLLPNGGIY